MPGGNSDWAGEPIIQLWPPFPPGAPPPSPTFQFTYFAMTMAFVGAAAVACGFLICQQILCAYVVPYQRRRTQRVRAVRVEKQIAKDAVMRQERAELDREAELEQIAPAPRVRPVAVMGTPESGLEEVALPPPPQPREQLRANRRVHPAPRSAPSDAPSYEYERVGDPFSPSMVLCSPFVQVQTAIAAAAAFGVAFGLIHLLLSAGPYPLFSWPVLVILAVLPMLCALLGPLFTPLALPEAAERGFIGYIDSREVSMFLGCLPFLMAGRSVVRLLFLGLCLSTLWVPGGLAVLALLVAPPFSVAELALFAGLYVLTTMLAVMPLGILGFCIEDNFDRALQLMSMNPNRTQRLSERLCMVCAC